jgi:hypothetical protein
MKYSPSREDSEDLLEGLLENTAGPNVKRECTQLADVTLGQLL